MRNVSDMQRSGVRITASLVAGVLSAGGQAEAQKALADYKRKQSDASKEAEELLEHTKVEAARLRVEAEQNLVAALKRREQTAVEKIAQAEAKAILEVRNQAVEIAIAATNRLLVESVDEAKASVLIQDAIGDLKDKLH